MDDFDLLVSQGNIGFYTGCEVTEIFAYHNADKEIFNVYTLFSFEENPYCQEKNSHYLGERIQFNKNIFLGVKRYWLTLDQAKEHYISLQKKGKLSDEDNHYSSSFSQVTKQYISANSLNEKRINSLLKNNFNNGSYIIEFFDENKKNVDELLNIHQLELFNNVCSKIKKAVPIDLSIARDRVGNIIFQFPITVLYTNHVLLSERKSIEVEFIWHKRISIQPSCLILAESKIDECVVSFFIEDYNQKAKQVIYLDNRDRGFELKIWDKKTRLILYLYKGNYLESISIQMNLIDPEPRIFESRGTVHEIKLSHDDFSKEVEQEKNYLDHIDSNLYQLEREQLIKGFSFRQYNKTDNAVADLRTLININHFRDVYLWDPYLSAEDIINTLFFCERVGVKLRAVGSINKETKKLSNSQNKTVEEITYQYRKELDNKAFNYRGINLEFRVQHNHFGYRFHDRFLLFPSHGTKSPAVYSLGTSVNSFGKAHHILYEVSHPQKIIDAFNQLWKQLDSEECVVWKYPK